jgi:hypothetical protein
MMTRLAPHRSARLLFLLFPLVATRALAASGNVHPQAIEIDTSANLHPASNPCALPGFVNGTILNPGATIDWVKDCAVNVDPPSLVDDVATGVITSGPSQTGAVARGHWNGVRIVDGIAGDDQNIFLTGGKENDTSTWNIGPGTVGSSKYDATQAYLANNQSTLFFGMERRGNNGTTAFDFEFNQLGPDPGAPLIPVRSVDDVLFTFEMMGSGNSGSAVAHLFRWDGSTYVEQIPAPAGLVSTINQGDTPAAPWGYVDSKGNWVTGTLPRFTFAEAAAPLATLPGVNACGGTAFVQIRTRSSASPTSDLKDTTRIFRFVFSGPSAAQTLDVGCSTFSFDGTGSRDASGGTNLTYAWDFTVPAGVTLSGGGVTPDASIANLYHATAASGTVDVGMPDGVDTASISSLLTVTDGAGGCTNANGPALATVVRQLPAAATKSGATGGTQTVHLSGSAPGATSVQWQRATAGGFVNVGAPVAGGSATLNYSNFETDAGASSISFMLGSDPYVGLQWVVSFRLHAERQVVKDNGSTLVCSADSSAVTVKKVTAVDP